MAFTGALYTGTIAQHSTTPVTTLGIWDPVNQTGSRFNFQGTVKGDVFGLYFRLREDDNWDQGQSNKVNNGTASGLGGNSAARSSAGSMGDGCGERHGPRCRRPTVGL